MYALWLNDVALDCLQVPSKDWKAALNRHRGRRTCEGIWMKPHLLACEPGEVTIFESGTLHGGWENNGTEIRDAGHMYTSSSIEAPSVDAETTTFGDSGLRAYLGSPVGMTSTAQLCKWVQYWTSG